MKLGLTLKDVSLIGTRTVLPTGTYPVEIVSEEVKEAKTKGNWMIEVVFKVVAGEYAGKTVTNFLNIKNDNEDATRIGLSQLKTILSVGGHKNPDHLEDSSELVGLELNIYLEEVETTFKTKDGKEIETTENKFKAFYAFNDEGAQSSEKKTTRSSSSKKEEKKESKSPFGNSEKKEEKKEPVKEAGAFPWQK